MKKRIKQALLVVLASLTLYACDMTKGADNEGAPGINVAYVDSTVRPQDDFYQFVNGGWLETATIPEDRTSWGGFQILRKQTNADVLAIIAQAQESDKYAPDSDQAKALYVFESVLDTVARNKAGIEPIKPALEKIATIQNAEDLQTVLAENPSTISAPFFGLAVFSDPDNSDINAAYIAPGGLGLPDRSYYVKDDENSKEIRQKYVDHITRMLQFLGTDEETARENAEMILAFETKLATPRFTKVESRDFRNFNNPMSIKELADITPAVNWNKYISDLGVEKELESVLVMQPEYMKVLQDILDKGNVDKWKTMMRWATLNSAAGYLTTEIEKANWDFYSKTLRGVQEQRPPKERALITTNRTVGEALGKLYVEEKFPPEAKAKAETMIANIIAAYEVRIQDLEWMSDSTKLKAIEKLDSFTVKIGYPDKWEDYSDLKVDADNSY
ncbi:MAG TPA: M13 family metallopeptidase N-terminal domain-containing protein, partial [Balneolaceae bacterium]|nr:M13 family metallopeptidase N-terminal domain-containing protein [Balneolaceae bacterium]